MIGVKVHTALAQIHTVMSSSRHIEAEGGLIFADSRDSRIAKCILSNGSLGVQRLMATECSHWGDCSTQ